MGIWGAGPLVQARPIGPEPPLVFFSVSPRPGGPSLVARGKQRTEGDALSEVEVSFAPPLVFVVPAPPLVFVVMASPRVYITSPRPTRRYSNPLPSIFNIPPSPPHKK